MDAVRSDSVDLKPRLSRGTKSVAGSLGKCLSVRRRLCGSVLPGKDVAHPQPRVSEASAPRYQFPGAYKVIAGRPRTLLGSGACNGCSQYAGYGF